MSEPPTEAPAPENIHPRRSGNPGPGDVARCECCGHPLPEQAGRARPRKYCPDGDGRFEPQASCRELGPALELTRRVLGTEAVPNAELQRLGGQVHAALAVFDPAGPIEALRSGLLAVATRLDETVAAALAERETARTAERDALGQAEAQARLRQDAQQHAAEAGVARRDAERARDEAEHRRAEAAAAQRRAEDAQARAEEARTLQEGRAERAELAAGRDRQRAERADGEVARLAARLETLQAQLDRAHEHAALAATEAGARLDRARSEAEARVDAAHAGARRAAEGYAAALQRAEREHATLLATQQGRAQTAEAALARWRRDVHDGLARLQNVLTEAPTSEGVVAEPTPRERDLRVRVDALLSALEPDSGE
jgi:colicin import membrane protein